MQYTWKFSQFFLTGPKNILKLFCFSSDVSYKVLLRGKSISGDPKKDSSLLLEEIEPLRKKWKQGKTKVRSNVMENRILLVYSDWDDTHDSISLTVISFQVLDWTYMYESALWALSYWDTVSYWQLLHTGYIILFLIMKGRFA